MVWYISHKLFQKLVLVIRFYGLLSVDKRIVSESNKSPPQETGLYTTDLKRYNELFKTYKEEHMYIDGFVKTYKKLNVLAKVFR